MQFGKLLEEMYLACGLMERRRVATGGSVTTIIDTGITNEYGENEFTGTSDEKYILFVSQTTDRLAPEGQYGEVTAFATPTTTPTFTIATMSAAVGAGDLYSLMKPTIQLYEMISRANEGLRRLTQRERTDTSLTGISDTLSYTLPFPVNAYTIQKIEIGNDTYGWEDAPGYTIVPATGSTGDKLLFSKQPNYDSVTVANKTIKITYLYTHPTMSIYSDYIEKNITDEMAIAICVEAAMEYLMQKKPSYFQDKGKLALYQNAMTRVEHAKQDFVVRVMPARRQTRLSLRQM